MAEISNTHVSPMPMYRRTEVREEGGPARAPDGPAPRVQLTESERAAAAARVADALKDGWDPKSQLDGTAKLDHRTLQTMNDAAAKIDSGLNGASIFNCQIELIHLMREIRNGERQLGLQERQEADRDTQRVYEDSMAAAKKEREASMKKAVGQIVQGVGQAGVAASTPNVATAQGVGAALGGMSELISAGDQQDATELRASAARGDKQHGAHMSSASRAQENAANAKQAENELTQAVKEMLAANGELAKVVNRG